MKCKFVVPVTENLDETKHIQLTINVRDIYKIFVEVGVVQSYLYVKLGIFRLSGPKYLTLTEINTPISSLVLSRILIQNIVKLYCENLNELTEADKIWYSDT